VRSLVIYSRPVAADRGDQTEADAARPVASAGRAGIDSRQATPEKLVGCSSWFSTLKTSGSFFSLSAKTSIR
jgi:hypothetical protein